MTKSRILTILFPMALIILGITAYFTRAAPECPPCVYNKLILDTSVTIRIFDARPSDAEAAADRAFEVMTAAGELTDRYSPVSPIYRINQSEGQHCLDDPDSTIPLNNPAAQTTVPKELSSLIDRTVVYAAKSGGAFDPTIEPLVTLWGIGGVNNLPSAAERAAAVKKVDYRRVATGEGQIFICDGFNLDLGGVSKGYAVDKAIESLEADEISSALITTISSTAVIGDKPDGTPWRIGIENPRQDQGPEIIADFPLSASKTVSTSGDYQRFYERDGKRYHHILDPRTGSPADGFMSVTVVTGLPATDADIISTALFVLGPSGAPGYLATLEDTEALFIDESGAITVSAGLVTGDVAIETNIQGTSE